MFSISGISAAGAVARTVLQQIFGAEKGKSLSPEAPANPTGPDLSDELAVDRNKEELLRRIVARYDLRRISHSELRELARELSASGVLREEDTQLLLSLAQELEMAGFAAHERIDLLAWCRKRLRSAEGSAESQAKDSLSGSEGTRVSQLRHQLALLEKLASLQSPW